jgi:pimeloyl-ACP methyl ester carboxylesterase
VHAPTVFYTENGTLEAVHYKLASSKTSSLFPTLLYCHGSPGGYDGGLLLKKFFFDCNCHLLSPSRPGYLGTPLGLNKSFQSQARLFKLLVDKLDLEKVILFAWSGGGPTALHFAAEFPEKVQALILVSAVTMPVKTKIEKFHPLFLNDPLLSLLLKFNQSSLLKSLYPMSTRRVGFANDLKEFQNFETAGFSAIKTPTLVIHAVDDIITKFENAVFIAVNIPHATFHKFQEGGHNLLVGHSDKILKARELIKNFIHHTK